MNTQEQKANTAKQILAAQLKALADAMEKAIEAIGK